MPYDEPEAEDPNVLVGVGLPADPEAAGEMAFAFAEEYARMGFSRERILGLFRSRFYAGAHGALLELGEGEVQRIVAEVVGVYGAQRFVVKDGAEPEAPPPPGRRALRVLS